jgi:serine/threonine protein kinase
LEWNKSGLSINPEGLIHLVNTDRILKRWAKYVAAFELHMSGILHCDIKPVNIGGDSKGKKVLLFDFGHA